MNELFISAGNLAVTLLDNPIGGYSAWVLLTACIAGWVYSGGEPPAIGPNPITP